MADRDDYEVPVDPMDDLQCDSCQRSPRMAVTNESRLVRKHLTAL